MDIKIFGSTFGSLLSNRRTVLLLKMDMDTLKRRCPTISGNNPLKLIMDWSSHIAYDPENYRGIKKEGNIVDKHLITLYQHSQMLGNSYYVTVTYVRLIFSYKINKDE